MGIILAVLQIIGWILLSVLLVVIAAVLIVVFCPVHYQIEGEWLEEKWAKFKVHWLLHLFRARISYGDDLIYGEIYILWKKITFSHDLSKTKEEAEETLGETLEETAEEIEEEIEVEIPEEVETVIDEPVESGETLPEDEAVSEIAEADSSAEKVIGTETSAELRGEVETVSGDVLENEISEQGISNDGNADNKDADDEEIFIEENKESILSKIKGILERIKEIYAKVQQILKDEQNQDAVRHLKNEIIYLLKIFIPKKSKIDAVFSTGSPDTTGQAFGVLACFPVMYRNEWKLMPDFQADEAYFKGTFWCKGWIAVYQFIGIVLRILFDKNCRRLYTTIRKFLKWIKKDDKSEEEK